jgi:hypothetical protein
LPGRSRARSHIILPSLGPHMPRRRRRLLVCAEDGARERAGEEGDCAAGSFLEAEAPAPEASVLGAGFKVNRSRCTLGLSPSVAAGATAAAGPEDWTWVAVVGGEVGEVREVGKGTVGAGAVRRRRRCDLRAPGSAVVVAGVAAAGSSAASAAAV